MPLHWTTHGYDVIKGKMGKKIIWILINENIASHQDKWLLRVQLSCWSFHDQIKHCVTQGCMNSNFWLLDLLEVIQGISLYVVVVKKVGQICSNFVFHRVVSLFENHNNSYHNESEQVQTCLRIIWIITIHIILILINLCLRIISNCAKCT